MVLSWEISALITAILALTSQPVAGIQVISASKPSISACEKLMMPSEKIVGSFTWIWMSSHSHVVGHGIEAQAAVKPFALQAQFVVLQFVRVVVVGQDGLGAQGIGAAARKPSE